MQEFGAVHLAEGSERVERALTESDDGWLAEAALSFEDSRRFMRHVASEFRQ